MLIDLRVRNLAVIEDVEIEFGAGLNVLTGETGAGKSIVVDALALLGGARATADLIRRGSDRLSVAGVFRPSGEGWRKKLQAAGVEAENGDLVVRREITREGRNRVFINDQPVTLRLLVEVAASLIRIHTQREELDLVSPELQRWLLDRSGGKAAARLLERTREAHARYASLEGRKQRLAGDEKLRLERVDLLRFQQQEIDTAKPRVGEEEQLKREREVLRHAEAIARAIGASLSQLLDDEGSAADWVAQSERALAAIVDWEPQAGDWVQELEELRIRLDEMCRELRARLGGISADPDRLNEIEDRLSLLDRLFRKYGNSSAEVLEYREQIGEELGDLLADDEQREKLEREVAESLEEYRASACELSAARTRWGKALRAAVHEELKELAMERADFSVALTRRARAESPLTIDGRPVEFGAQGIDEVTFELAANPGEARGPLSKAASGGELSRVYLALQLGVRRGKDEGSPTLVFDEIDAGIGGAEAAALGKKLRRLAGGRQILAATHLPQVASCGHRHFGVRKAVTRGRTRIAIEALESESRIDEIARMLAGDRITDLSRSHAEELLTGRR
jgi:DNA repair protein RecN (Recombination protein N)